MTRLTLLIINFLMFHTCWLATAFGAAHDVPWLGPAFVVPAIALHLFLIKQSVRELILLLIVALLGYGHDTIHFIFGNLDFHSHLVFGYLPPVWLFFQWLIFATLLRISLAWMKDRWMITSVVGAVGGPLAYWAASELDSLLLPGYPLFDLGFMMISWAILMPFVVWIAHYGNIFDEGDSTYASYSQAI